MHDYLVVGAGLYGAVVARELHAAGKSVLVVEKNRFVGGNAADRWESGQLVNRFGGHIFHTNSDRIWNYLQKYSEWVPYRHEVLAYAEDRNYYSLPFNMWTFSQIDGVKTPALARKRYAKMYSGDMTFEQYGRKRFGDKIYELLIDNYTRKQWGYADGEEIKISPSVLDRIPVRYEFDNNYFNDKYQALPSMGYTHLVRNLLGGIPLIIGAGGVTLAEMSGLAEHIVYSGQIDSLFDYEHGELEYRSLEFRKEVHAHNYLGAATINHTGHTSPYTREVNYRYLTPRPTVPDHSVVALERSVPHVNGKTVPMYPIGTQINLERYCSYVEMVPPFVTVGGRLGAYKYYDMDQTIAHALKTAGGLLND